jgi:hypothetical protein
MSIRNTCILLVALCTGAALFAGCAPKKAFGPGMDTADAAYTAFRDGYCHAPAGASVLISGSLYYTRVKPTKRSNRTLIRLWGDFSRPLRLDVAAGMGRMLAHIREDRGGLTAFYPDQKAAYTHMDPVIGATRLGMPFPFSLRDLALVLGGSFSELLPYPPVEAVRTATGFEYSFSQGPVTRLKLDGWARPVRMEGATPIKNHATRGWSIDFSRYPDDRTVKAPLPRMLSLALESGEKGVLRVKNRELKQGAWPEQKLDLPLPEGTELFRLDARRVITHKTTEEGS